MRKRAVADGEIAATQVDHGGKAEVHPAGLDLAGHQPRVLPGKRQRGLRILRVVLVESVQRRQRAVALAETLHAPTFLVDADQLRAWRGLADRLRQLGNLRFGGEVARKQDHPRAGVVLQPVALLRGEFSASHADYEHLKFLAFGSGKAPGRDAIVAQLPR